GFPLWRPRNTSSPRCVTSAAPVPKRRTLLEIEARREAHLSARVYASHGRGNPQGRAGYQRLCENTEGPRERARHHRGLALALSGSQGLRLGPSTAPENLSHEAQ